MIINKSKPQKNKKESITLFISDKKLINLVKNDILAKEGGQKYFLHLVLRKYFNLDSK